LDVKQMQSFARLAGELHFGRAAETLGMSQSTLSSQIVALERDLDTKLFERTQRRVQLTAAGAVLLENIEPILAQLDDLQRKVREAGLGEHGSLIIGASEPAINSFLPDVIQSFRARYPHVKLRVRARFTEAALDDLLKYRIDIAFARPIHVTKAVECRVLGSIPYRAILPVAHRAASKRVVTLSELCGETLFTYPRRIIGGEFDTQIAFCNRLNFVPSAIEEVEDTDTIIALVACGLGVSILPRGMAINSARVVAKPIAGSAWKYEVAALWRAGDASAPTREFLKMYDATNTKLAD
jgi:DNA-binding transcriptional LysR family regulator